MECKKTVSSTSKLPKQRFSVYDSQNISLTNNKYPDQIKKEAKEWKEYSKRAEEMQTKWLDKGANLNAVKMKAEHSAFLGSCEGREVHYTKICRDTMDFLKLQQRREELGSHNRKQRITDCLYEIRNSK